MASHKTAQSSRLAALYSSLSRLTTEHIIDDWDEAPSSDTIEECRLTLVGKILSDPSINLPALQTTLRKAWRIDSLEWYSERMLIKAVQHLGEIKEMKLDSKEGQLSKAGRVRVQLNVHTPLVTGKLIQIQGKPFWLDFCSHFCFSCGKLGHYAMYGNSFMAHQIHQSKRMRSFLKLHRVSCAFFTDPTNISYA